MHVNSAKCFNCFSEVGRFRVLPTLCVASDAASRCKWWAQRRRLSAPSWLLDHGERQLAVVSYRDFDNFCKIVSICFRAQAFEVALRKDRGCSGEKGITKKEESSGEGERRHKEKRSPLFCLVTKREFARLANSPKFAKVPQVRGSTFLYREIGAQISCFLSQISVFGWG